MRDLGQSCPKLWSYLGMKNALTPLERETMQEDPYTSAGARLTVAMMMYNNWKVQQQRTRKPSQSAAKMRSRMDVARPTLSGSDMSTR